MIDRRSPSDRRIDAISRIRIVALSAMMLFALSLTTCQSAPQPQHTLFQTSTLNALLSGIYDGKTSFKELKSHGDLGIGTFSSLDGEMIGLDGKFYQVTSDGLAHPVTDDMTTPFAAVTTFDADKVVHIEGQSDLKSMLAFLDNQIPSKNLFYAIRIEGTFNYVRTRSVPKQQPPYRKLIEIVAKQPTFEFENVSGTLVGLRCPEYAKDMNAAGYHFHFLTADRSRGGHVLECRVKNARVSIQIIRDFRLILPDSKEFNELNTQKDTTKEVEAVEKGK